MFRGICRPDISNAVIKLTQYNTNPARCHYEAAMQVFRYLAATKDRGLHYWRKTSCPALPKGTPQQEQADKYECNSTPEHHEHKKAYVLVDSDWADNIKPRRSVSGIAIMMA